MSAFGIFLLITFIIIPTIISLILIRKIWQRNRQDFYILLISIFITAGLITLYELNKLSSYEVIQVLLTATLVLVTTDYALHTKKMAEEMKEQRLDTVRPVLDISATGTSIITITCKNVGVGPAINLRCWIDDEQHKQLRNKATALCMGALAAGSMPVQININTGIAQYTIHQGLGFGFLRAQYCDVYGNTFESRFMSSTNAAPELIYSNATEIITL